MRLTRRLTPAALVVVAVALAGCSTPFGERINRTFSAIGAAASIVSAAAAADANVARKAVLVSAGVFDGLEATATNYLRLKPCSGANEPVCREPAATVPIIKAVRSGRVARRAAVRFVKDHPCPKGQDDCSIGAGELYDALQSAIAAGQQIFSEYRVAAAVSAAPR